MNIYRVWAAGIIMQQRTSARLVRAFGLAALVLGLCGFAPDSLKTALQARYDAMKAAMAAHDGAAIAAILAPDFTSLDTSGHSQTATQMIAEVNALKPDPSKTSTTTLESVAHEGDTTIVQQRYVMRTTKAGPDGAEHKVELVTLSTDTWVKPQTIWLMRRTVTNELSLYVDGALVAHKVRP